MKIKIWLPLLSCVLLTGLVSCDDKKKASSEQTTENAAASLVKTPTFSGDSAYNFIAKQVDFGPRVPGSAAHQKCGDYLVAKLKQYGCVVIEQKFTTTDYTGRKVNGRNIIGSLYPQAPKRIIISSHWDSRPVADEDTVRKTSPIAGANDGASGVGVCLEIARILQNAQPAPGVGVDIIFWDLEDMGNSTLAKDEYSGFCLGSQYWANNKHVANYSAYFGILLDMVGAKNATFPYEQYSTQYAGDVQRNIWNVASQLGFSQYFIAQPGAGITDDHLPVNKTAKIPMVDIIHTQINSQSRTFFEDWHTHEDDMRNIDALTLKAVGQTLTQVLYQEGTVN
jgi:glutaminyl-peptide cyclotransferase